MNETTSSLISCGKLPTYYITKLKIWLLQNKSKYDQHLVCMTRTSRFKEPLCSLDS